MGSSSALFGDIATVPKPSLCILSCNRAESLKEVQNSFDRQTRGWQLSGAQSHYFRPLKGVLITEAPQSSGALITANFALEQGREVFAVPGSILSPGSVGVNKLIQDGGACLVTNVNDILEALNLFMVPQHVEMQAVLAR